MIDYSPDWNFVELQPANAQLFHVFAYFLVIICFFSLVLLGRLFPQFSLKGRCWRDTARFCTILVFLIVILFQVMSQNRFLDKFGKILLGKSTHEKYMHIYHHSYAYAQFVLEAVPFNCHGQLITNFDIAKNLEPYVLKYFLFPRVNIIDEFSDPACLLIYSKDEPQRYVPDNYKIIGTFDRDSLIAIKK